MNIDDKSDRYLDSEEFGSVDWAGSINWRLVGFLLMALLGVGGAFGGGILPRLIHGAGNGNSSHRPGSIQFTVSSGAGFTQPRIPMFARHDTIAFIAYPKEDGTYSDLVYQVFRARDRSARVVDTGNIALTDSGNGQLAGVYEPAKLSPGTYGFALSPPLSIDNKGFSAGTFVAGSEFMIVSPPRVVSRVAGPGTGSGTATDRDTGMQLSVDRIRLDPAAGGGDAESRAGTTFLLLHVTFRNAGSGAGNFDASNVVATDQSGQSYHPTPNLSHAYSPQLDTGAVSRGHRQAGWIGYQVPYSVRTLQLTWSDLGKVDPPARLAAYALHN